MKSLADKIAVARRYARQYRREWLAEFGELRCEICNSTERVECHHPDYDDPCCIEQLCLPCHRRIEAHLRTGWV
jgi:hypothetical protein